MYVGAFIIWSGSPLELEKNMIEVNNLLEQINQRLAKVEMIIEHPDIKNIIIERDRFDMGIRTHTEINPLLEMTWNEILANYELPSLRSSKN